MNIEQELQSWLSSKLTGATDKKARDIQIILYHYGFGPFASPTLDDLNDFFSVGSKERVRQIISEKFRDKVTIVDLPVSSKIFEKIQSHSCVRVEELTHWLKTDGLISDNTRIRGLLNLAHDLNSFSDYELYDIALEKIARPEDEAGFNSFVIKDSEHVILKKNMFIAKTLPGSTGLAKMKDLQLAIANDRAFETLVPFVREATDVCIIQDKDNEWYIFEGRDNTLINSCEKIFSLTEQIKISTLSSTLANSLRSRSQERHYPDSNVISAWIENSRWFHIENQKARFWGEKAELTLIETHIVDYLKSHKSSKSKDLNTYLAKLGHKPPSRKKTLHNSALVTVDKTAGLRNYTYSFIGDLDIPKDDSSAPLSHYISTKNHLKELYAAGTDVPIESIGRQEQKLLSDWLFKGKTIANCAICGETYGVKALFTAHKKKRAFCTDTERIDPNIVFPLCQFGCDYLYERGYLRVVQGKVEISEGLEDCTYDGKRAMALAGREIEPKWLEGSESYFKDHSTRALAKESSTGTTIPTNESVPHVSPDVTK